MRKDEIIYSLKNLMHRKLRTWLTILSILIGITAIFALISFGLGIQNYVNVLADEAGRDKLFIQAKGVSAPGLDSNFFITKEELDFVSKIKGVEDVTGLYMKVGEIKKDKQIKYNFLIGVDPDKIDLIDETFTVGIYKGRHLKKGELGKVNLGYNYQIPDKIFKKGLEVGDKVEVNGEIMSVVGFYEEVGNPGDDGNIYVTHDQMETFFPATKDKFGYAIAKAEQAAIPDEIADKIEEKLRKHNDVKEGEERFFVQTFDDVLATFGIVISIINGVLVLIALISLIVASVNIMNTMYTAVLERTQEIGVMKAIGARNSDIGFIFVFESGFLGMVGGILGVILGYIVARTGGNIAAASGFSSLQPIFPWYLTFGCILFAFLIGAVSGILPALQASKLQPVEALRYE